MNVHKTILFPCLLALLFLFISNTSLGQTSWKGTSSTSWKTASNWTAGVPTSSVDAIIGDANFVGPNQPTIGGGSSACKSLTIGAGTGAPVLTQNANLSVAGNLTIGAGAQLVQSNSNLSIKGSWSNAGTYTPTNTNSKITFTGIGQTIGGTAATPFKKLIINAGSTITLNTSISVTSGFTISGTFTPAENATPYLISGAGSLSLGATGILKVNAATFAANYSLTGGFTIAAGGIVDYSATLVNQTIKENLTYSTLRISGAGVKTLGGNLNALNATTVAAGNITVSTGTLDLSTFTANRGATTVGGALTVANGATLKIGGTNPFPSNYDTRSLSLTSTVEYSGTSQAVSAQTYGNLTLSSASGAAVKTMPATDFTVAGNFTSNIGTGTSVSFTAASNISISGNVSIGASTTFNGGSFTHNISGNWTNGGTFTGSTSTVNLLGAGSSISGAGTHNFNNLSVAASNITGSATSNINVAGNLSSTGPGSFTHGTGGTFTMSGATKTMSGTGFIFDNLTISGSVSTSSNIIVNGNLAVSGSFTNSSNTITLTGAAKTISGAGTIGFSALYITGSVTTAVNFSIAVSLNINGSLTASAGTATFTGSSTLNGTANLFNVTINGTSLQLSTNAVLGIAGVYTITSGALDVTSTTPNTVNYNGGAQFVTASNYGNLILSNGSTKTAGGGITVLGDITIDAATTFNAATFTHTISGNWVTTGTFSGALSNITFSGTRDVTISGAITFGTLTINKSAATNQVVLQSTVTTNVLTMTRGGMNTGGNLINITASRSGSGIILGTIRHTHAFIIGTPYAFEGPDNTIAFTAVNLVSSVTVTVTKGSISDFPFSGSINRVYNIALTGVGSTATVRLHYEDAELNGNTESTMQLWHYNGSAWAASGKTTNSTTSNYIELIGITSITDRWTLSDNNNLVRWNGSVSSDWFTAANWTSVQGNPSMPPSATDIVEIGTSAFTNQPTINGSAVAKSITLGSTQAVTLTLTGGSLTTQGNINGTWSANATHTINANNQSITINGDLELSDGTSGHVINLNMGTGTTTIGGTLTESGGANLTFSGNGTLNIGNNFNYTSGTFTPASGTVTYNGTNTQTVAGVTYNHLIINKTTGIAAINTSATIGGDLSVTAGELDINIASTITGNVTIASGAIFNGDGITTTVGGNWNNSGTFLSLSGTILLNGSGTQTISATTFNNLTINKSGSIAVLTGNLNINGNLTLSNGTLNLSTYTSHRSSPGGTLTASNGTNLMVSGASNLPANYTAYVIGNSSTVTFDGTVSQTIPEAAVFGNVIFSNGGVKTLAGSVTVNGDLTINSGANFSAASYTINLGGNWLNSGTFTSGTGTVILNGSSKTITGNTTFNKLTIYGSYLVNGSDLTFNGLLQITASGSFNAGSGSATVSGDLTNSGTLLSNGITTFSGTGIQVIRLLNAITSNSSGVINFNGSVSPVLNSTSAPIFATLNVNNTAGINPSVGWTIAVAFNISAGGTFNGGVSTHNILGSFTNSGTVTSSGIMNFIPAATRTITLVGTGFSSTGTVIFGGSGAMTVAGIPTSLNNVTIANTNGVSPTTNWAINGTFLINSNGIFNAGSNTYTINGDIQSNGTLNGGTSVFTLASAAGELSGSPATTFYDLTITGNVAASSDFNVSHNFTNNNIFDTSAGTLVMTGAGASSIGGTASPFTLAQFAIYKSTGGTATLAKNVTGVSDLHVLSGIFDTSTFTITQDASGGSLTLDNYAFFKIAGTNTLPTFNNYAIDTLSTVEYYGSTQAISSAASYGNLTISTAGTKTASAALHILNDFSLANGTFVPGNFTDIVEGNWNMTSGTFTNTGNTIVFTGTLAQTIFSTGAFNNLTVNKAANLVTLSANATVNNILNFTAGKIKTGSSNRVILPSTGSVTGASQSSGWVFGRLQKNIATGSNITRVFEIGDSTSYTPATTVFLSVSTLGSFSVVVTNQDHPNLSASGINANRSVNRYWSYTNSGTVFTTASVTVNWVAADIDPGSVTANFNVGNYNGSTWSQPAVASPLSTSIQATGLTFIGDICIGEFAATTWTGSVSINWYTGGNWSAGAAPGNTSNITIPTGLSNYPTISTGTATANNIIIQSGASLTVTGAALQISGSITNSGTFTASNGTVEMTGTTAQTIPAATFAGNAIKNLTINNTAGVTLGGTLNITAILLVSAGQLNTGGYLTLVSSAAQTALIDGSGAGSVSGNVTMQRYLAAGYGYKYFSSPFQAATVSNFSSTVDLGASFANFYTYIENQATSGFTAYTTGTNLLYPLQGYAADFGAVNVQKTISITGAVNNGSVSATLYNHNQPYTEGFNLVGNPYPSPIDWNAASGWTKTNIDNAVYYFDSGTTNQYTGTYSTYINGISSDGIAGNVIASMQGFFVHVSNGTYPVTGTFAVNNNVRVNNLSPVFHKSTFSLSSPTPRTLVRLSANFADNTVSADPLVVYSSALATSAFDKELDAIKLMNTSEQVPNLYLVGPNSSKLAINALLKLDTLTVMPLGLQISKDGPVTFNLRDLEQWPYGLRLYFTDAETGMNQELQQNTKLTINLKKGVYENRFSLRCSPLTAVPKPVITGDNYYVYKSNGVMYMHIKLVDDQKGTLTVSNMMGQVIFRKFIDGNGDYQLEGRMVENAIYVAGFATARGVYAKKFYW
jgi:fibronectin-binding autotransporter adhesin